MNIAEMNCKLFRKDTLREHKISCEFRSHLAYNCDQKNEKKNRAVKTQCFHHISNDMSFQNLSKFEGKKSLKLVQQPRSENKDYSYFVFVLLLTLSPLPQFSPGVESKQHFHNFFHVTTLSLCTFSLQDKF